MFRFFRLLCWTAFGFPYVLVAQPSSDAAFSDEAPLQLIREQCEVFPEGTQLAMAFLNEGKVHFMGFQRMGDSLVEIDNRTAVFEVGSITKVFTSTLLAQAVGAEQVQLDQDIRTLGLEKLWVKDSISLLNLANHSSGLPRMPSDIFLTPNIDHQNPFKGYTGEILEAYLAEKVHLDHPPGEQYAYSNLGAGLLGYLLAKQADMNYPELLQRQIFDPIGMKNSGCERADFPDQVVPALGVTGDTVPHWDWQSLAGAGVILSTVEDLGKFVKQHFEQEDAALNLTREPTLRVSPKLNIGLGWHIIRGKDNREVHWHNGGTAGFSSHLSMDMETEQAVIILSNVSAYHPKMRRIDQMGFRLLKRL